MLEHNLKKLSHCISCQKHLTGYTKFILKDTTSQFDLIIRKYGLVKINWCPQLWHRPAICLKYYMD